MKYILPLKYILKTITGCVITPILLPILIPPLIIFGIISLIVSILIKIKYGSRAYKARGTDVAHGKQSANSLPMINIAIRLKGKMDLEAIRKKKQDLILSTHNKDGKRRYERLMELYSKEFGYYIWKSVDKFDINNHVIEVPLSEVTGPVYSPSPISEKGERSELIGVNEVSESNLHLLCNEKPTNFSNINYIQRYHREDLRSGKGIPDDIKYLETSGNTFPCLVKDIKDGKEEYDDWPVFIKALLNKFGMTPFQEGIPQWQVLCVKESEERFTVLYRFHHAITDGIYLSRMFWEDILDEPFFIFSSVHSPSNLFMRIMINLWSICLLPFGLWTIMSKHDRNPLHGPTLTGRKKFFMSKAVPVDDLRAIKAKTGISFHSIIFSCVSYAISRHFQNRGTEVPKITALSPYPLQNNLKQIKLKNNFAVASTNLPIYLSIDEVNQETRNKESFDEEAAGKTIPCLTSLERLRMVQKSLEKTKQDPTILALHMVITNICSLLPVAISDAILSIKGCTIAISSIPGPKKCAKVFNSVQEEHLFWVPDREPMGAGVSVMSYNGCLRSGLVLDEALLASENEGDFIMEDFEREVRNILKELKSEHLEERDESKY